MARAVKRADNDGCTVANNNYGVIIMNKSRLLGAACACVFTLFTISTSAAVITADPDDFDYHVVLRNAFPGMTLSSENNRDIDPDEDILVSCNCAGTDKRFGHTPMNMHLINPEQ